MTIIETRDASSGSPAGRFPTEPPAPSAARRRFHVEGLPITTTVCAEA